MTTDPCWKLQGHDMRAWAESFYSNDPNRLNNLVSAIERLPQGHGLGPLDEPCQLEPGVPCEACGKVV